MTLLTVKSYLYCQHDLYISLNHSLWASLVAQMIKNLPAVRETWVRYLSREDLLEEGMTTHYSCLENPMDRGALVGYSPWGCRVGFD